MTMKNLCSIVLFGLGIALFIYGNNMSKDTALQEARVSEAEAPNQKRPILGPIRRAARNQAAESKQETLSEVGQTIVANQVTANWLRGIGAVLFVLGVGGLILSVRGRSSQKKS